MEFSDNRSARHAGAVFISGRGSVDASGFINNAAGISGGAVYSLGQLNIARSDFLRNRSNKNGGAIFNDYEAHITIRDSEFSDNSTRTGGGGVFSYGRASATISDSRFTGNSADQGGGVMAKGFARGGRTFYGELSPAQQQLLAQWRRRLLYRRIWRSARQPGATASATAAAGVDSRPKVSASV